MIRRMFLSRIGGVAAIASLRSPADVHADGRESQAPTSQAVSADTRFQPARHSADDWFDLPGKHRLFFDALTARGADDAPLFAGNFFNANKNSYGLENGDIAVVICLRHHATPFAFNDAIWAKYGAAFSDRINFVDPKTKAAPSVNVHAAAYTDAVKRGIHFAVCDMATHFFAGAAAAKAGADVDAVYKELVASTFGNSHFVPAGIVAVNRAQERGYSIAYVG
jgi:hypothetical protein